MDIYDVASKIVWLNYIFCATEMLVILIFRFSSSGNFSSSSFSFFFLSWGFCGLCFSKKEKIFVGGSVSRISFWRWKSEHVYLPGRNELTNVSAGGNNFRLSPSFPFSPGWFGIRRFLCWTFAICFFLHSSSSFLVAVWHIHVSM